MTNTDLKEQIKAILKCKCSYMYEYIDECAINTILSYMKNDITNITEDMVIAAVVKILATKEV